jgi:hypothetical protein
MRIERRQQRREESRRDDGGGRGDRDRDRGGRRDRRDRGEARRDRHRRRSRRAALGGIFTTSQSVRSLPHLGSSAGGGSIVTSFAGGGYAQLSLAQLDELNATAHSIERAAHSIDGSL